MQPNVSGKPRHVRLRKTKPPALATVHPRNAVYVLADAISAFHDKMLVLRIAYLKYIFHHVFQRHFFQLEK